MLSMPKKIELVYFNAGGGHRAAAQALQQVMLIQGWPWQVDKVNLIDVLDPTALFNRLTGMAPEDLYNKRLASGFTLGLAQELKLLQGLIRIGHTPLVQRLARHWQVSRPDLVVSLIPNFNRALHDSLALVRPGAPLVTVLTDMADHPPNFWIEPGLTQHVVCGTEYAARQALAAGCDPRRVHRTSGMILRPDFYFEAAADRTTDRTIDRTTDRTTDQITDRITERRRAGLDESTPTGLVMFGGAGSRVMKRISARLEDTPLILMCGRNEALADDLRARPARAPRAVVGYTQDVARWMALADFFIGKPGPGSLSEAVQQGLPVIVTRNAWTMPQERWNTEWVQQHGLGVVERSFRNVGSAVQHITAQLPQYKRRVQQMHNRAVFELPHILQRILEQASQPRAEQQPALLSSG